MTDKTDNADIFYKIIKRDFPKTIQTIDEALKKRLSVNEKAMLESIRGIIIILQGEFDDIHAMMKEVSDLNLSIEALGKRIDAILDDAKGILTTTLVDAVKNAVKEEIKEHEDKYHKFKTLLSHIRKA